MDETTLSIIASAAILALLFAVAFVLQKRSQTKGNLFSFRPTLVSRVGAALLGLLLLGFSAVEYTSSKSVSLEPVIAGAACLLYAIGSPVLMRSAQGASNRPGDPPVVTRADIERIVRRDYSPEQRDEVMAILQGYETPEAYRIWADILKVAGGSTSGLHRAVDAANVDFRDVIAAAEYPLEFALPASAAGQDTQAARSIDRAQYDTWLKRG